MASSSARPHRQSRSGVSYRDPYYDYEDDFSFCRRRRSSPSPAIAITSKKSKDSQHAAKKNLALKPAKNRANAKERAEAVQLQRAINESLSQRSSEANVHLQRAVHEISPDRSDNISTSVFDLEKSMVDCMDEHALETLFNNKRISMDCADNTAINDSVAFQCLLDVATEAVLESTINSDELQDTRETGFIKQNEEDQASNWKRQIAAEKGAAKESYESVENFQSWNLRKSRVFDRVSAGQQGIPVQSPTLLHRRVIGLSRRHRPPPLHPYLAKRDR